MAKSVDAVDSKSTVEIRAGSSPGLRTTPYANRVAQERLFLCLKSPISVQYIGLPEKQFSILHFVVDGPKFALAGSCIVHITWAGWFRYAT